MSFCLGRRGAKDHEIRSHKRPDNKKSTLPRGNSFRQKHSLHGQEPLLVACPDLNEKLFQKVLSLTFKIAECKERAPGQGGSHQRLQGVRVGDLTTLF